MIERLAFSVVLTLSASLGLGVPVANAQECLPWPEGVEFVSCSYWTSYACPEGFYCVGRDLPRDGAGNCRAALHSAYCYNDRDADGVKDHLDRCRRSSGDATVMIDTCDSGVANSTSDYLYAGCFLSDAIEPIVTACSMDHRTHGGFVSCFADEMDQLTLDGILAPDQKGALQRCAARANLPLH